MMKTTWQRNHHQIQIQGFCEKNLLIFSFRIANIITSSLSTVCFLGCLRHRHYLNFKISGRNFFSKVFLQIFFNEKKDFWMIIGWLPWIIFYCNLSFDYRHRHYHCHYHRCCWCPKVSELHFHFRKKLLNVFFSFSIFASKQTVKKQR